MIIVEKVAPVLIVNTLNHRASNECTRSPKWQNNVITSTVSFFAARSMMSCLFLKPLPNKQYYHRPSHTTMDSLFAKADAIQPLSKKNKPKNDKNRSKKSDTRKNASTKPGPSSDRTRTSITQHTSLPRSLRPTSPLPENVPKHGHIKDLKLRAQLGRQAAHAARTKALLQDAELLLTGDVGMVEVENEMEKTWRVSQDEIVRGTGQEAAKGRKEWILDGGPYRSRYSRNGRFVPPPSFFFFGNVFVVSMVRARWI